MLTVILFYSLTSIFSVCCHFSLSLFSHSKLTQLFYLYFLTIKFFSFALIARELRYDDGVDKWPERENILIIHREKENTWA